MGQTRAQSEAVVSHRRPLAPGVLPPTPPLTQGPALAQKERTLPGHASRSEQSPKRIAGLHVKRQTIKCLDENRSKSSRPGVRERVCKHDTKGGSMKKKKKDKLGFIEIKAFAL